VEHRRAVRFSLLAPVIYRWKDPSGKNRKSVGCTRDISILGAFIVSPSPPPVQTPVSLEIHLPPLERNDLQRLRLEAKGRVTRVTSTGQDSGFAATSRFELYEMASLSACARPQDSRELQ